MHDWVQSTLSPIAVSVLVGASHACPDDVDVLLTNLKELDNLLPQDLKELFLADDFDNVREGVAHLERLVTVGLVQKSLTHLPRIPNSSPTHPPQDHLQISHLKRHDNSNNAEQPHVDANTNSQNMIGRHTHTLPDTH